MQVSVNKLGSDIDKGNTNLPFLVTAKVSLGSKSNSAANANLPSLFSSTPISNDPPGNNVGNF